MAQLVLGVAGAAVGSLFSVPQLGWMVGVGLGSALAPKQKYEQPQIEDLRLPRVELGQPLTWVAGSPVVTGNVIYSSTKRPIKHTESAGGKGGGGGETTYWTYEIDLYMKVAENIIRDVNRVSKNGDLVRADGVTRSGVWSELRVYTGEEGQLPDPDFEAAVGADKAQAHLGCGAVFIKSLQLDSGGNLPVLKFELATGNPPFDDRESLLVSVFATRRDTNLRDKLDIANTSEPTWNSYFEEFGSSALLYALYYTNANAPGDSADDPMGAVPSKTISIDVEKDYYLDVVNGFWAGDIADAQFEFLNSGGGVVAAIVTQDAGAAEYQHFLRYGPNLSSLTTVSQALYSRGTIHFGSGLLSYTRAGAGTNDSFTFACDALSIRSVRVSGVRVRSTYTGGSPDPGASILLRKIPGDPPPPAPSVEATVSGVVSALMLRAGYAAEQFDVTALESITKPVRGLAISRLTSTRAVLELLATTHAFTWQKRGFQIVFLPRVVDVVATVPFEDLGVSTSPTADKHPFELQFASELEQPAQISVTYPNTLNDYQPDTQVSDWILSQQQSVENIELAVGMTPAEAKAVANSIQLDRLAALGKTTVSVTRKWAHIEPNDVINVLDQDGRSFRLRVGDVRDHMLYIEWDLVLDDVNATLSAAITDGGHTGQGAVKQMAATILEPLDIPLLRDADNSPGWWVACGPGEGDLWPGATVLSSWDGVSYSTVVDTPDAAVLGTTTTVLGNWAGGNVFDTTNSVTISINGEASSYTRSAMLADLTLGVWLIGNEIVRARTATLVSEGVYVLSNLLRGFRGTTWAMGTHEAGERVVLINSALRRVQGQQAHIGLERQLKGVTAGLAVSTATAVAFTDTGIALKPFAPVDLLGAWDVGTGDLALTWRRHPRLSHRFLAEGIDPPLGETSERYDVEIWDTGFSTLKRTFSSVTTPSQAYTAAQQTTDFGAPQSSVGVRVYQRSEAVGRGYVLQGVV